VFQHGQNGRQAQQNRGDCLSVTRKLTCPKCKNDMFKLNLSERQETSQTAPQITRMKIVTVLYVKCAKCGWGRPLVKAEG